MLTERFAVLTHPGAPSRAGETENIGKELVQFYDELHPIRSPGTLDGGDVVEAGNHFFIGISARTNETGAQQFADLLSKFDYTASLIDIRYVDGILHLKSGLAYLPDNVLVVIESLRDRPDFHGYDLIPVNSGEEYAANCVSINGCVLVAAGHPAFGNDCEIAM